MIEISGADHMTVGVEILKEDLTHHHAIKEVQ
jgi:hypothetical protein